MRGKSCTPRARIALAEFRQSDGAGDGLASARPPLKRTKRLESIMTSSIDGAEIAKVLADREQSYRLFSRLFMKPLEQEDIDALTAMELEKSVEPLGDDDLLARGFNDMGRGLHRQHTATKNVLSTDFTMCFDGVTTHKGLVAVPYASIFAGSLKGDKAIFYQEPRDRDLAAYRGEQIKVDPDLHLPEDHLSFELSFMADLSRKAAHAYSKGEGEEVLRLMDVSRAFLQNNILSWYGAFYELALNIIETRFYRGVLEATYGYLRLDDDAIGDLMDALLPACA